eukprot:4458436-Pleurochrysis_carterae.AAC.5
MPPPAPAFAHSSWASLYTSRPAAPASTSVGPCVASSATPPRSQAQRRPSIASAASSGMMPGRPSSTRSSTASASGWSPCGESEASSPRTLKDEAHSPRLCPIVSTPGKTPSLALNRASACTLGYPPPIIVSRSSISMPPASVGRRVATPCHR